VRLEVRGDSQLVIRQLEGEWKAKDPRMRELRDQALRLLKPYAEIRLVHQDRARSVAIFGH
jgi:ribonuclease HI